MRDHEETVRRAIIAAGDGLTEGDPMQWSEGQGYGPDPAPTPDHWQFSDGDETFYIYTGVASETGDEKVHERFNNEPCSLADLELTAIAVLSALNKAYEIERVWSGK